MMDLFGNITRSATFSECRKYRYVLMRSWDPGKEMVAFIGLNPSTANEADDDNTITKVQKIAFNNGFGGIYMINLFGIISSDPDYIYQVEDPVGEFTDHVIKEIAELSSCLVACWGNFKQAEGRDTQVTALIGRKLSHLQINKNGSPKHPLYCRDHQTIVQPKPIHTYESNPS